MGYFQLVIKFWRELLIIAMFVGLVLQNNSIVKLEADIVAKDYQIQVCAKNQENFNEAINKVNEATSKLNDEREKLRLALEDVKKYIETRPKPDVIVKTIDRVIPSNCEDKFLWILEQNDAYEAKWGKVK